MTKIPTIMEMLKAGVHFGHRKTKKHPKMDPYIFGFRNSVNVIDLEKTSKKLEEALEFLKKIVSEGGVVLFVGTKVPARTIIKEEAEKCGMPYVINRWFGGTLTNFDVILKRISYLKELEAKKKSGELKKYTKKEQMDFDIEMKKLNEKFGGIREMRAFPQVLFVLDTYEDNLAVREAKRKNIPVVALVDTNSDPAQIDYPIPSNDDAISALKLMVGAVGEAIREAKEAGQKEGVKSKSQKSKTKSQNK